MVDEMNRRTAIASTGTLVLGTGCMSNLDGESVDVIVHNLDNIRYRTIVSAIGNDMGGNAETQYITPGLRATFEEMIPTLDYPHEFTIEIVLNGDVKYSETQQLDDGFEPQFTIRDGEVTTDRQGESND